MREILMLVIFLSLSACGSSQDEASDKTFIYTQPLVVADDDWQFVGTEHLAFVPENRLDPKSRMIALSFLTFPAKEPSSLPPVAFLGAGPGEPYSAEVFFKGKRAEAWRWELEKVNQKRDVILINQRGNSESPGLPLHNFRYKWNNGGALDKPFSRSKRDSLRRVAYHSVLILVDTLSVIYHRSSILSKLK